MRLVLLLQRRYAERLDRWTATLLEEAEAAVVIFEAAGDHAALARAWRLVMNAHGVARRFGEAAAAAERAGEHARLSGDVRQEARAASGYAMAALYGPTPVAEAIARCEQALVESRGDKRLEGLVLCLLAPLRAMQGDFEVAREHYARGRALLEDIGGKLIAASTTFNASTVDMLAGDAPAAEERLRRELDLLEAMGETYLRPTVAAYLAAAVANQGRYEEADRFAALAAELASEDDVTSQAMWRSVRARVLVREGKVEEADRAGGRRRRAARGKRRDRPAGRRAPGPERGARPSGSAGTPPNARPRGGDRALRAEGKRGGGGGRARRTRRARPAAAYLEL